MTTRSTSLDLDLEVRSVTQIAEDVVELELVAPAGAELPEWVPGSHIDLVAGDVIRQYSLCGVRTDRAAWRIAVLRESAGRGGSAWLHALRAGDRIQVQGMRNHFPLDEAEDYLFIAGGIGITPLLPMIDEVARSGKQWRLVHVGRSAKRLPYGAELVRQHPDRVTLAAVEETGRPDLDELIRGAGTGTIVYCCGPERMMKQAETAGVAAGVDVRVERFVPKEQEVDADAEHGFEVELTESEMTLHVPADRSILDVATEAGVFVLSSCTEGTCGSCETEVVSGSIDHRDSILTESERASNSVMFVCCSRAKGDKLVLRL